MITLISFLVFTFSLIMCFINGNQLDTWAPISMVAFNVFVISWLARSFKNFFGFFIAKRKFTKSFIRDWK